ncbi:unnamed protein product [Boreogadus saida]
MAPSNGLCRYGARMDCCWGWTRRSWGHCQPLFALTHRVAGIRCQPQGTSARYSWNDALLLLCTGYVWMPSASMGLF